MRNRPLYKPEGPFVLNSASPQAKGLRGWWPGEGAGGKMFDRSGNGYTGTLTGFSAPFTSTSGWAAGKDGGKGAIICTGAFVDIVNVTGLTISAPPFTVSCWTKKYASGQYGIMNCRSTAGFELVETGGYLFYANYSGIGFNGPLGGSSPIGVWKHVAVTMDANSETKLYVDGVLVSTYTPGAAWVPDITLRLGGAPSRQFELGTHEDFRYYNRALSAPEIAAMYDPRTRWQLRYVPGKITYFKAPPSGGGGYTLSDSPFTTDSIVRALTLFRTASDSPSVATSVVRVSTQPRTLSDSPSTAGTVARIGAFTRTMGDTPTTTDSIARTLVLGRTVSDVPTTSDAITRAFTGFRTAADSPTTSDAVTAVRNANSYSRTASDSPTTTDSVIRTLVLSRSLSDAPSTTDAVSRAFTGFRTATDSPTTSDSVTAIRNGASLSRTLADSPTTTDAAIKASALIRSLTDAPSTADAISRGFTGYRTLADAPFTTDIVYYTIPTADSAVIEDLISFGFNTQEITNFGFTTTEVITYG